MNEQQFFRSTDRFLITLDSVKVTYGDRRVYGKYIIFKIDTHVDDSTYRIQVTCGAYIPPYYNETKRLPKNNMIGYDFGGNENGC